MDVATVASAVREFGFPIVTALALGWWTYYQDRAARAERAEFLVALKGVTDGVGKRVDELHGKADAQAKVLERLVERLPRVA